MAKFAVVETVPQEVNMDFLKAGGQDSVVAIWARQPDGYFCVSFRHVDERTFHDVWYEKRGDELHLQSDIPDFVNADKKRTEQFFCVAGFKECRRTKDNVLPSRWLFADLDYVPPHEIPITPTFSWQTSPGKWQAIWYCEGFLEPAEFRHLNRAMNHVSGADPGTWNVNRLLRVPGSYHLKEQRA